MTLPEEFCTEVRYCLAQLKFQQQQKKWAHDFGVFPRYPLWDNTNQNIYKDKAESNYMKEKKVTRKIYERDWRLHHNKVSMIIRCPWKCHSELVTLSMLQIYPLDSKRAKVSIVFKWQTALSPFGWFLLNPSKEKHSSNKHCQVI